MNANNTAVKSKWLNSCGQSAVEVMLCMPIVIITLIGLVEMANRMVTMNQLNDAAREGVRYATETTLQSDAMEACSGGNRTPKQKVKCRAEFRAKTMLEEQGMDQTAYSVTTSWRQITIGADIRNMLLLNIDQIVSNAEKKGKEESKTTPTLDYLGIPTPPLSAKAAAFWFNSINPSPSPSPPPR